MVEINIGLTVHKAIHMNRIRFLFAFTTLLVLLKIPAYASELGVTTATPVLTPPPLSCDNAPTRAVLSVDPIANRYLVVQCTPLGHKLAPTEGYIWLRADQPVKFPFFFYARTGNVELNEGAHSAYFVQQGGGILSGDALARSNKLLEVGYKLTERFSEVVQIEFASSSGFIYTLFLYLNNARPRYVLGCLKQCATSVLLREYTVQEAAVLLGAK
jgi:hypothetical protein